MTAPTPDLAAYFSTWSQHSSVAQFVADGWQLAVADLNRIGAVQPLVHTDHGEGRLLGATDDDLVGLARVSVPMPSQQPLMAHFDNSQQAWVFSSANPNLRIVGQFSAQVQPGTRGFGFLVGLSPSFMQVASYQRRLILRDGYHRAYAFLRAGITRVPVLHREFATSVELALPPGLFPHDVFLGERPPLLSDYLEDDVSAAISMPATQKVVIIQGIQLSAAG